MRDWSRNKVLLTIIAVLLITNVVMLVLYLEMSNSIHQKKSPGFTERLKKDVGFNEQQMAVYEPKRKAFWANMRKRFDEIKTTKQEFYYYMYDPNVPDSTMEVKADSIGIQQKELDLFVIRHFKDVRKLCTSEQLPKYDSLLPLIIERMTARPKRNR